MVENIVLNTLGELIEFSTQNVIRNYKIMNYTYRGLCHSHYNLKSGLQRLSNPDLNYIEKRILTNFRKYGQNIEPKICDSVWENMIIAQHHGLPTRLLDFSVSPLVAMHFALSDIDSNDSAIIWAISHVKLHELLPDKYKRILESYMGRSFTVEMLKDMQLTLNAYDQDMGTTALIFLEPPSIDQRIVNQFSHFAIMPNGIDTMDTFLEHLTVPNVAYKFLIPAEKNEFFANN